MELDKYTLFETYRLGILLNILAPEELIETVDELIEKMPLEEIPHVYYALSLTKDRQQMLELLTDLTQGVNKEMPGCIIAGLMYKKHAELSVEELFEIAGRLAVLVKDPYDDVIVELRELKEKYGQIWEAYGLRFKRKKARERMFAKNEKQLMEVLKKYESYAEQFREQDWSGGS